MGSAIRRGDNTFILPLTELTLGNTYEIAVNATDAAGNTYAAVQKSKFTVVARPQTNIALEPGMNLVSFPEIPAEPGINEVFPASTGRGRGAGLRPVPRRAVADLSAQR